MLIEERPGRLNKFARIIRLKCPNCGAAKVFYRAKFPGTRPKMKTTCDVCGYNFDREAGFYKGAVYLSYGMTLVEGFLVFLLAKYLIFGLSLRDLVLISLCAMLFLGVWNYKLARVIWINNDLNGQGPSIIP
jgi:rubredoxin